MSEAVILAKTRRIKILNDLLANQIAAGEVVERPASVVKELLENSCDAGATQCEIRIEEGGIRRIQITDNGCGIHPEDLILALQRHATSKIRESNDLRNIHTLGFRGEALASIASVAKVTLISRMPTEEFAYQVDFDPMTQVLAPLKKVGHPPGTTVIVEALFHNVPARKHFLKSSRTEWLHIEEVVKRFILSRAPIGVKLYHQHKLILQTTSDLCHKQIVGKILNRQFIEQAISINHSVVGLQLTGWIGTPEQARQQSEWQYLSINGRMIRDKLLTHAIREAYQDRIYPGKYPVYVLSLTCDPGLVDVNVHPTKHEVRFREARLVHDFVVKSIISRLPVERSNAALNESVQPFSLQKPVVTMPRVSGGHIPYWVMGEEWLLGNDQHQRLIFLHVGLTLVAMAEEAIHQAFLGEVLAIRRLLIPLTLTFTKEQLDKIKNCQDELRCLGIEYRQLNETQLVVQSIASVLNHADVEQVMLALSEGVLSVAMTLKGVTVKQLGEHERESLVQWVMQHEVQAKKIKNHWVWRKCTPNEFLPMLDFPYEHTALA